MFYGSKSKKMIKLRNLFAAYRARFQSWILTLPAPCISEGCIEIKINLNFKHFFVVPQKILWRPLGLHKTF